MKHSLGALVVTCASLGGVLMSTSAVAEVYVTVANRQNDRAIVVLSRRVDRDRDWRELGVVRGGQVADFVLPRQGVYEFRATNRRGDPLYATNPIQLRDGQSLRIRGNGNVVVSNDRGPDRRFEQRGVPITR
jgi:hypothetical protein